jgi:hypothetical protein
MEIRYTLAKSDWDWVVPLMTRHSPYCRWGWNRYRQQTRALLAGQVLFVVAFVMAANSLFKAGDHLVGSFCVFMALATAWAIFAQGRRSRWAKQCTLANHDHLNKTETVWSGPCVMTLDERGIHSHREQREHRYSWQLVSWTKAHPEGVLIGTRDLQALVVPSRALGEVGGPDGFKAFVDRLLANSRGEHSAKVIRYLADNDFPCPICGYNMRGLPSPHCPECDVILDESELPIP